MKISFPFGGTALILLLMGLVGMAKNYLYTREGVLGISAIARSNEPKAGAALDSAERALESASHWSSASTILLLLGGFCALLWFRQRVYRRMLKARGLTEVNAPRKMPEAKLLPRRIVRQARRR
ncbi:MAG TPA: hypothetical protein VGE29_03460 [Prosthecobacter sp.]